MRRTLATVIGLAALGLGCARDVPVYSPQPEVVQEFPGVATVYKSVWSDAERLKISWYVQTAGGASDGLAFSWSRYEPSDSAQCLMERFDGKMRVDFPEEGIAGWVDLAMEDGGCDYSVDFCIGTYIPDSGDPQYITADVCSSADQDFVDLKNFVNTELYNIDEQLLRWHKQKGTE